ncbi:MAG TPA: DegQ family serine endoprotease [Candidatus Aphodousia gallistercoris]|nr:DegQ family serine endoprotease [Candidatus Aphodousia gallistercoris]
MKKGLVLKSTIVVSAIAAALAFMPVAHAEISLLSSGDNAQVQTLPDFTKLVEENGKGVVNISTIRNARTKVVTNPFPGLDDRTAELFRRFGFPIVPFGPQEQRIPEQRGTGSGFIISSDGLILTNAHVVEGADELRIRLTDNREFSGKVLGLDKKTDIAVVKIEAKNLPVLKIGSSENLKVGEWVAAIGSPFGLANTVTAGIVSAKSRALPSEEYVPFIQTDVAVNPGNSGGPLFNMKGEVVGINSQIFSTSGGFMGLSFSIPIDLAIQIKDQLIENGRVIRGRIGVGIQSVTQDLAEAFGMKTPRGAVITQLEKDQPGEKAGLKVGDIVIAMDGKEIKSANDLPVRVSATKPGTKIDLTVLRDGKEKTVTVTVAETPSDEVTPIDNKQAQGKLGVSVRSLTAEELKELELPNGLLVTDVRGAAAKAGLMPRDIIISANGKSVKTSTDLINVVKKADKVALLVQRQNSRIFVAVDLK